jgi:hypothetical protein
MTRNGGSIAQELRSLDRSLDRAAMADLARVTLRQPDESPLTKLLARCLLWVIDGHELRSPFEEDS